MWLIGPSVLLLVKQVETHYQDVRPRWAALLRLLGSWWEDRRAADLALCTPALASLPTSKESLRWMCSGQPHFLLPNDTVFPRFFNDGRKPSRYFSAISSSSTPMAISCSNTTPIDFLPAPPPAVWDVGMRGTTQLDTKSFPVYEALSISAAGQVLKKTGLSALAPSQLCVI